MKERGILFSDAMVMAILEGRKTQTRRLTQSGKKGRRASPDAVSADGHAGGDVWYFRLPSGDGQALRCPYGATGDTLWVREAWRTYERPADGVDGILFRADQAFHRIESTREAADRWLVAHNNNIHGSSWRPSIHLPRWASRITLVVTEIRVQRLQEISDADACAEGCANVLEYEGLWDSIHDRDGDRWADNPLVWVVSFRRAG